MNCIFLFEINTYRAYTSHLLINYRETSLSAIYHEHEGASSHIHWSALWTKQSKVLYSWSGSADDRSTVMHRLLITLFDVCFEVVYYYYYCGIAQHIRSNVQVAKHINRMNFSVILVRKCRFDEVFVLLCWTQEYNDDSDIMTHHVK